MYSCPLCPLQQQTLPGYRKHLRTKHPQPAIEIPAAASSNCNQSLEVARILTTISMEKKEEEKSVKRKREGPPSPLSNDDVQELSNKRPKAIGPTAEETRQLAAATEEKTIEKIISTLLGQPRIDAIIQGRNYVNDLCPICKAMPDRELRPVHRATCRAENHPWTVNKLKPLVSNLKSRSDALILHLEQKAQQKTIAKLEELGYTVQLVTEPYTHNSIQHQHPVYYQISW